MTKATGKFVILITVLILAAGYYFFSNALCYLEDYCPVAALEAGPGRVIKISRATEWEVMQPYYYEVEVGSRVAVPRTYIMGCCRRDERPEFKLLTSRDGDLVGVVWAKRPGALLLLHDFTTGETWPRGEDAGARLRDRLNADNPQLKLELSWHAP